MAEARLKIGSRNFRVACEDGQEDLLQSAAALLDEHARSVLADNKEVSEAQLLLMTGLLVADQAKSSQKENSSLQAYQKELELRLSRVESHTTQAESKIHAEYEQQIVDLKAEAAKAKDDLEKSKTALEKASSDASSEDATALKNAQSQVQALKAKLEDANRKIESLKVELESKSGKGDDTSPIEKELSELKSKHKEAVAALVLANENASRITNSDGRLRELEEENAQMRNQIELLVSGAKPRNLKLQQVADGSTEADLSDQNDEAEREASDDGSEALLGDFIKGLERLVDK